MQLLSSNKHKIFKPCETAPDHYTSDHQYYKASSSIAHSKTSFNFSADDDFDLMVSGLAPRNYSGTSGVDFVVGVGNLPSCQVWNLPTCKGSINANSLIFTAHRKQKRFREVHEIGLH